MAAGFYPKGYREQPRVLVRQRVLIIHRDCFPQPIEAQGHLHNLAHTDSIVAYDPRSG